MEARHITEIDGVPFIGVTYIYFVNFIIESYNSH